VFIYYAYQNYDQLKQFKKDINAQLVEVTDFKHKFYSIQDYIIPEFILNKLQDLKAFEVRKDDVWVASFPKSGAYREFIELFLILNLSKQKRLFQ
jgi:hypothetical protein